MGNCKHEQRAYQTLPQLAHTSFVKLPLPRRIFMKRLGLFMAAVGLPGLAASQDSSESVSQVKGDEGERGTKLNTSEENRGTVGLGIVGLVVRDLSKSLDFYRKLGLAIPDGASAGSNYRMRLPNGQVFFWDNYETVRSFDPDWEPSSGNRRIVLEFGFATAQAVDDKYAELTSAGYEGYLPPRSFGPTRYALIKDPDDNEIGLRYPES